MTEQAGVPGSRRTLLVGAGKVGTRLGQRLVERGDRVFALRRDPSSLPPAFTPIAADLSAPLTSELPDVDAMVITLTPGRPAPTLDDSAYLASLRHLADALPSRPDRVVFVSSTGVFEGRPEGAERWEGDVPEPETDRGRLLLAGERTAVDLFGAAVVRPAGIYGPGREFLLRKVLQGEAMAMRKGTNRIHEFDLVTLLETLIAADGPRPALVHAVDRAPAPMGEVVGCIGELLGVAPPPALDPDPGGGAILRGRIEEFTGPLRFPTYVEGYADIIARRSP
ncbi:SDR family oxidoreductase [Leucobacter tardus]|uniref:NAD(P)H-binding protein n=1 Tax=Leucobacter tardus TaxID=501483 RepID=A0A939QHI2_9MICO|nr:NAD(P)H-binding protein [Leucobacter tardus]MBO2990188.1 NAD(P)H-binding protein [Leucobacter tardus]